MTINEKITIIISILSFLLSLLSLVLSRINMVKVEKIYYGQAELSIRDAITSAKNRVASAIEETVQNPYKDQLVKFAIEEFINSYEEACSKYIDKKVDKKRFKKMYFDEIKNIIESDELKKYFQFGSKYDSIKTVYNEWFNLE